MVVQQIIVTLKSVFFSFLRSGFAFFAIKDFDIKNFVFAFNDFAAAKISFFANKEKREKCIFCVQDFQVFLTSKEIKLPFFCV